MYGNWKMWIGASLFSAFFPFNFFFSDLWYKPLCSVQRHQVELQIICVCEYVSDSCWVKDASLCHVNGWRWDLILVGWRDWNYKHSHTPHLISWSVLLHVMSSRMKTLRSAALTLTSWSMSSTSHAHWWFFCIYQQEHTTAETVSVYTARGGRWVVRPGQGLWNISEWKQKQAPTAAVPMNLSHHCCVEKSAWGANHRG